MVDKLKSVSEVVRSIPSGSHVALGGFAIARNLIAVVHELIRQQKRDLTVSQGVVGLDTDLLVGAGLARHLIMGGGSLDRFGPVHCVNRARETKSQGIQLEELLENTGFPLHTPNEVPTTPLPTAEELRLLREEIDPKEVYLK